MNPSMLYAISQQSNTNDELVVPVRQGEDPDLQSGGVCRAMTFDWAKARLKGQPWRGFSPSTGRAPLFAESAITKKFPWLNTQVAVTKEFQELQDLSAEEMVKRLGIKIITQEQGRSLNSPTVLFDHATKVCKENFGICVLKMTSTMLSEKPVLARQRESGHALGFRMTKNANEFFDANSGWYTFASYERFCHFFVPYIGVTGYKAEYLGAWELYSIV